MPDIQNPIESYPVYGPMAFSKKFGPLASKTQATGSWDLGRSLPEDPARYFMARLFGPRAYDHKVIVPCACFLMWESQAKDTNESAVRTGWHNWTNWALRRLHNRHHCGRLWKRRAFMTSNNFETRALKIYSRKSLQFESFCLHIADYHSVMRCHQSSFWEAESDGIPTFAKAWFDATEGGET